MENKKVNPEKRRKYRKQAKAESSEPVKEEKVEEKSEA